MTADIVLLAKRLQLVDKMGRWPGNYDVLRREKGALVAIKTRLNERRSSYSLATDLSLAKSYSNLLSSLDLQNWDDLGRDPVALWILDMTIAEIGADGTFCLDSR